MSEAQPTTEAGVRSGTQRTVDALAAPRHEQPTVVLADDHPAVRLGVRMALLAGGLRVLAEAADCDGAVKAVTRERPDVCLLDIYMPGGGIQAAATIAAVAPETAVVMLTVSDSTEHLLGALRAGAVGYLPKDMAPDRLPAALRGVLAGETALPRGLVGPVLGKLREMPGGAGGAHGAGGTGGAARAGGCLELTGREDEIMRLLRSGLCTADIGRTLSLSPVTVRRHISAAVAKLGVADREEAIRVLTPSA